MKGYDLSLLKKIIRLNTKMNVMIENQAQILLMLNSLTNCLHLDEVSECIKRSERVICDE